MNLWRDARWIPLAMLCLGADCGCNVGNAEETKAQSKVQDSAVPQMPAFDLPDLAGKRWNGDAMKGRLVLVDFWDTRCQHCKTRLPMLDRLAVKYRPRGFEALSVSTNAKRSDLDGYLKGRRFAHPVLHDDAQTWQKWGVKNIPATFLIKEGRIVGQWTSKTTEKELDRIIEQLTLHTIRKSE